MPVQPHLLIDAADVSAKAIVAGDPGRIERIADLLDSPRVVSRNRGYLVIRGAFEGKDITLCAHGIGAPSAAIAFTELWRCGVRDVIRVGTCGALRSGIGKGAIIIATGAVRGDGVSPHYVDHQFPAIANQDLERVIVQAARQQEVAYHEGIVWTTDIYYQRDLSRYRYWSERGVLAVEMEVSALFTLSQLKGRRAAAILVVDGNVLDGAQNLSASTDRSGLLVQHDDTTRRGIDAAVRIALAAI